MYAIITTGGKQYRVEQGTKLRVESLPQAPGEDVALDQVLLLKTDSDVRVGNPLVAGARVVAQVVAHDRSRKIIVFKKRSKKTYKKTIGHRQNYTELLVKEIQGAERPLGAQGSELRSQETPSEPAARSPERR